MCAPKSIVQKAQKNKFNSLPVGANSNYYANRSSYANIMQNKEILNNINNSKNSNINTMNINITTNNPQQFAQDYLGILASKDNGMVTGW